MNNMRILVVGAGGREHALVWALSRGSEAHSLFTTSRNAGILKLATPIEVNANDVNLLADWARSERIDLTVVGPEKPLVDGLADEFLSRGLAVFGPSAAAAQLEGSKLFAKRFMDRHGIPTARYLVARDYTEAQRIIREGSLGFPLVIKADGLAAGKGVVIADDPAQAEGTARDFMLERTLGDAGETIVIEECLAGREVSFMIFTDGRDYAPLPLAQDHKRALDGDFGPNTGGMGAFSVNGLLDSSTERRILDQIVHPTLEGAAADGFPFRGVLYVGLMLTEAGASVLEYNVRLGDPETQAILRRLDTPFAEIAASVANGDLCSVTPGWSDDATTCVVIASGNYPAGSSSGVAISGLESAEAVEEVVVFHAGTRPGRDGSVETAGGRILGVTARAPTLDEATRRAYQAVDRISFEGMRFRRDIGKSLH